MVPIHQFGAFGFALLMLVAAVLDERMLSLCRCFVCLPSHPRLAIPLIRFETPVHS